MDLIHRLYLSRLLPCILILIILTGCLSPMALNRAVIAYDNTVTDTLVVLLRQYLLLYRCYFGRLIIFFC